VTYPRTFAFVAVVAVVVWVASVVPWSLVWVPFLMLGLGVAVLLGPHTHNWHHHGRRK
jgi:hypothetical protein